MGSATKEFLQLQDDEVITLGSWRKRRNNAEKLEQVVRVVGCRLGFSLLEKLAQINGGQDEKKLALSGVLVARDLMDYVAAASIAETQYWKEKSDLWLKHGKESVKYVFRCLNSGYLKLEALLDEQIHPNFFPDVDVTASALQGVKDSALALKWANYVLEVRRDYDKDGKISQIALDKAVLAKNKEVAKKRAIYLIDLERAKTSIDGRVVEKYLDKLAQLDPLQAHEIARLPSFKQDGIDLLSAAVRYAFRHAEQLRRSNPAKALSYLQDHLNEADLDGNSLYHNVQRAAAKQELSTTTTQPKKSRPLDALEIFMNIKNPKPEDFEIGFRANLELAYGCLNADEPERAKRYANNAADIMGKSDIRFNHEKRKEVAYLLRDSGTPKRAVQFARKCGEDLVQELLSFYSYKFGRQGVKGAEELCGIFIAAGKQNEAEMYATAARIFNAKKPGDLNDILI